MRHGNRYNLHKALKCVSKVTSRLVAIALFIVAALAIILYQQGYYDISFIKRPETSAPTPSSELASSGSNTGRVEVTTATPSVPSQIPGEEGVSGNLTTYESLMARFSYINEENPSDGEYNREEYALRRLRRDALTPYYAYRFEDVESVSVEYIEGEGKVYTQSTETLAVPAVRPYMGMLIIENEDGVRLCDAHGEVMLYDISDYSPALLRDGEGNPLFSAKKSGELFRVELLDAAEIEENLTEYNEKLGKIDESSGEIDKSVFDYLRNTARLVPSDYDASYAPPVSYASAEGYGSSTNGLIPFYVYGWIADSSAEDEAVEADVQPPQQPEEIPPATEPPETEPPIVEPPAIEPVETEPPVTEPPVTEPPVSSLLPTLPTVIAPAVSESVTEAVESSDSEPQIKPDFTIAKGASFRVMAEETEVTTVTSGLLSQLPTIVTISPETEAETIATTEPPVSTGAEVIVSTEAETIVTTEPIVSTDAEPTVSTEIEPSDNIGENAESGEAEPVIIENPDDYAGKAGKIVKLWGYRRASGEVVIEPKYYAAYNFSDNGLAAVVDSEGYLRFINRNGRTVIDPHERVLYPEDRNRRPVYDGYYPGGAGNISDLGMYFFDRGLVRVRQKYTDYYSYDVISDNDILIYSDGLKFTIPEGYTLEAYSDGVLMLSQDGRYGFLDYTGSWIAQPVYTKASPFCEGLAVVGYEDGKVGLIDTDGNLVLPMMFDYISDCSSGIVAAYSYQYGWEVMLKIEKNQ